MLPNIFTPSANPYISTGSVNFSNIIIDAANEQIGVKFYAQETGSISAADLFVTVVGDCSGINFVMQIETDSSDAPSGTVLGSPSSAFAGPNVSGGAQQFLGGGTDPVNLGSAASVTINTPYWLVLKVNSGTPDATHSIQARGISYPPNARIRYRHHNGTNWTTTTPVVNIGHFVIKYSSNRLQGFPAKENAKTTRGDIFVNSGSTQVQGLRLKFGCQVNIKGLHYTIGKYNFPDDLIITVYEVNIQKVQQTIDDTLVVDSQNSSLYFSSPVWLAPNKNINIVFSHVGTSDSNDYSFKVQTFPANYKTVYFESGMGFIYGTLGNPDDLSLSTTELPCLYPIIDSISSDILSLYHSRPHLIGV